MLYLHSSERRARVLDAPLEGPVETTETHWLDHWFIARMDLAATADQVTLFMNASTKYVKVHVDDRARPLSDIVAQFIERLGRFSGYNLEERYQDYQLCRNEAAGDMALLNDLIYQAASLAERQREKGEDISFARMEYLWNSGTVNNQCPFDSLMTLLQDGIEIPFEETSVPYLRVVR